MADIAPGTALQQRGAVLTDEEGLQLAAVENGAVQPFIHAEQVILIVKDEFFAEEAEFDGFIDMKLILEGMVLLPEVPVFQKLLHIEAVAVLGIHHAVAVIADVVSLNFPGEKALYLSAADGAGGSFIEQAHNLTSSRFLPPRGGRLLLL